MKNLYEYIRNKIVSTSLKESLLDDVDTQLDSGDELMNEFTKLKEFVLNRKNWKKDGTSRTTIEIKIDFLEAIPNLLKLIKTDKSNLQYIRFKFYRHTYQKEYRGNCNLYPTKEYTYMHVPGAKMISFEVDNRVNTPNDILKYILKPMFSDINTFINTLNNR